MALTFLTFGGPSQNYHSAVNRITNEAKRFELFDNIVGLTEDYLKNDTVFWKKHQTFMENNSRGYGYWLWKSYITKKQLEQMNENDILLYADAGCTLNIHGKKRLKEYIQMAKDHNIVSFQMNHHLEQVWTKMDTILELKATGLMETGQLIGGIFLIKKCKITIDLVNRWYNTCCKYHLLNDNCVLPNHSSFRDNRHDQSIWSILRKQNCKFFLTDETYTVPWNTDFPIWATRMRN